MKNLTLWILGVNIAITACNSPSSSQQKIDSLVLETNKTAENPIDEQCLISPGKAIGVISLGEDLQEIGKKLGKPDFSDAAMGKAWEIWKHRSLNQNDKDELAIYSSYRDDELKVKDVKQIRITSPLYKTSDGFGTANTLQETKSKFTDLKKISTYLNEAKDTVNIYDETAKGISFEFIKEDMIALTVHDKDKAVNQTYLTLHPDWKPLK